MTAGFPGEIAALDQGAFLEAIGIDPDEVLRDTTKMEFMGDAVQITWTGFKMVPMSKLMYALTEAEAEAESKAAARATAVATPKKRTPSYAAEKEDAES